MKKTLLTLAIAIIGLFTSTTLSAQDNDNRAARRAEMRARQTERLIRDLKLSDEQKTQFEPAYQRYLNELEALITQEPAGDRQNNNDITDEEATAQIQAFFTRQEQQIQQQQLRLEIQKKYLAEFSAYLSPKQLLRVFRNPQRDRNGQGGQQGGRGPRGGFGGGPRGGGFGGPQGGGFGGDF